MKVGISTATLFLKKNNEEALPLFASWGVPCAEVFLTSFCEYAPSFAEQLAAVRGDVEIHSLHVLNTQFEPQLYADHPRVRGGRISSALRGALFRAHPAGAKLYVSRRGAHQAHVQGKSCKVCAADGGNFSILPRQGRASVL